MDVFCICRWKFDDSDPIKDLLGSICEELFPMKYIKRKREVFLGETVHTDFHTVVYVVQTE